MITDKELHSARLEQISIFNELGVMKNFTPGSAIAQIVQFLKEYLESSKTKGFVLGVSGGQDSTLCGKLAQMAIDELNEEDRYTKDYYLYAVKLPYRTQKDEADADLAMRFIRPRLSNRINIAEAVYSVEDIYYKGDLNMHVLSKGLSDFGKGNVKARMRMVIQYAIAGEHNLLVLGTDHAAEAIMGFYTKYGDGAADLTPLTGLTKRQGKAILQYLNCPPSLYEKVPTADLEDLRPQLPDEEALGLTYEQIDDYLELKSVPIEIAEKIEARYNATMHKRNLPATRFDRWW